MKTNVKIIIPLLAPAPTEHVFYHQQSMQDPMQSAVELATVCILNPRDRSSASATAHQRDTLTRQPLSYIIPNYLLLE
jgi:hypothetical protein